MSNALKKMVLGSMGAAGLVALLAAVDIVVGFPFSQQIVMDVLFLLSAGVVIYMGYEAYQELT